MQAVPNIISIARLVSVPVIVWLILFDGPGAAFGLFVAAAISDALDGFLAQRFNARSALGSYLDPLADKALLIGVYISLGIGGHLPVWLVMLVVFRDIVIIGGALVYEAVTGTLTMEPLMISKINTVAQIVLAGFVLAELAFDAAHGPLEIALITVVAATTLLSGAAYIYSWTKRVHELEQGQ